MNYMALKKAQDDLGQAWEQYQVYRDSLPKDEAQWTAEQRSRFDKFDDDLDRLEKRVDQLNREKNDEERQQRFTSPNGSDYAPPVNYRSGRAENGQRDFTRDDKDDFDFRSDPNGKSERHAFNRYLLHGDRALSPDEFRALSAGSDISGGYLNAPQVFVRQLIASLNDEVFIRRNAQCFDIPHSMSLGAPVLTDDLDDCTWTTELLTGSEDTMEFGKRELKPFASAKRIKVSRKLLATGALNPETLVKQRLTYRFGITEENAFLNGDGVGKPLGIFVASSDGISTDRDVVGSNTATVIKADTLIDTSYSMKAAHAKNAIWIFSREAIRDIRKLKDSNDQYLWQRGLAGADNTILERPYEISEYCPHDFSAGKYVGAFADLSYYWIATALEIQIQKLVELYAETNQVGYIGRMEVDGMPVLEEAFSRIKLASE